MYVYGNANQNCRRSRGGMWESDSHFLTEWQSRKSPRNPQTKPLKMEHLGELFDVFLEPKNLQKDWVSCIVIHKTCTPVCVGRYPQWFVVPLCYVNGSPEVANCAGFDPSTVLGGSFGNWSIALNVLRWLLEKEPRFVNKKKPFLEHKLRKNQHKDTWSCTLGKLCC